MAPYLQLDLNSIPIDEQLAQRVPYALSRYYLALPLGQDNGSVSVAMAYPDNIKARQILSRLLHAKVVPVFTPAESLQPLLERIHCSAYQENQEHHDILSWYGRPQHQKAVTATANMLGETLQTKVTSLTASESDLGQALALAATECYELAVLPLLADSDLVSILNRAETSLFFVRDEPAAIRRILVVMRGYASDERALDWLAPFAWQQQATVTLMPLTNGSDWNFSHYHHQDSLAHHHLDRCLQRLQTAGIQVHLKFRQGSASQQVVEEVSSADYDLLAIAAEGDGGFVSQVITAVDQHPTHSHCPIFVLKPPSYPIGQPLTL